MALILSAILKVIAYSIVVRIGLKQLWPTKPRSAGYVARYVLVRIVLGLLFSVPMWMAGGFVLDAYNPDEAYTPEAMYSAWTLIVYFVVYGAFRWLLWAATAFVISPSSMSWKSFFFGAESNDRRWRLQAVMASFLCDVPIIIGLGGPIVGKFFC